ncbi:hypothetical protein Droror1_Dr00012703 [Drosera rotundifolia]
MTSRLRLAMVLHLLKWRGTESGLLSFCEEKRSSLLVQPAFWPKILNEEIFKCLQQTYGESYETFMLSKLVPVAGNLCETGLGLTQDSTQKIIEDVDVIIHSAANTNFQERYDSAIEINTLGPNHVMDLAKQCKKLKLFLQVSTAYVNGQRQGTVLERPFRWGESITMECFETRNSISLLPVLDVEHEVHLALKSGEDSKDREAKHRMIELGLERARKHGWQDTYVFTKAMGEMLLGKARGDVPLVILRPSVIESTYNDPFPGWIEGYRTMAPIVISYGRRRISGFLFDPNSVLDVVPVDMVVNTMLAAIAKHGLDPKPNVHVYQVTSSVKNPLTFRQLCELFYEHFTGHRGWIPMGCQSKSISSSFFAQQKSSHPKFGGKMSSICTNCGDQTGTYQSFN